MTQNGERPAASTPLLGRAGLRRAGLSSIGLLVAVALFLAETRVVQPQLDDAFISYRYAVNLADGLGLVYNPGEYVEGFTTLLWVLLVGLGVLLGGDAVVAGHTLGVAAGVGILVAAFVLARAGLQPGRAWMAGLVPLVVLAHPSFVRWAESGMESTSFAFLVTLALVCDERGWRIARLLTLAVAIATRPEGAAIAAILLGRDAWTHRADLRRALRDPAILLLGLIGLTAFRLVYYGSPLPNTFYAKVTTDVPHWIGGRQLLDFLKSGPGLLIVPALHAAIIDARLRGAALVVAFSLGYLVWIGGDAIGPTRFLLPALPALAAMAARGAGAVVDRSGSVILLAFLLAAGALPAIGLVPTVAGLFALAAALTLHAAASRFAPARGREIGIAVLGLAALAVTVAVASRWESLLESSPRRGRIEHLRDTAVRQRQKTQRVVDLLLRSDPRPELVATSGIGYVGYTTRLPILDLVGLVDHTVARTPVPPDAAAVPIPGHLRSNAAYVIERAPDWVLVERRPRDAFLRAHRELLEHPEFRARYAWDRAVGAYRLRRAPRRS